MGEIIMAVMYLAKLNVNAKYLMYMMINLKLVKY